MDQSIKAGIIGTILTVFISISIYVPAPFDFLPIFLIAIFIVYVFRLSTIKDALLAVYMTYVFNNGILGTLTLAIYYINNEPYSFPVDPYTVLSPIITSISITIAAYIGVWLNKKRAPPPQKQPPQQSTDIPPELQTV
jgi:uncharacterized membrane protein YfcA